ncbi:hypothetical protein Tcan_16640 [Toxocara canis]|uniref:Uncharacterized protein n=1 Tax=Toxocara canis TaxID=6265 RepID=A0A0B2VSF5_TOXCA|nr:hypothetical protein Tcan_16640 [Toxocara canis]
MSSLRSHSEHTQACDKNAHQVRDREVDVDPKDPAANEAAKKIQHAFRKYHEHVEEEKHKAADAS